MCPTNLIKNPGLYNLSGLHKLPDKPVEYAVHERTTLGGTVVFRDFNIFIDSNPDGHVRECFRLAQAHDYQHGVGREQPVFLPLVST